jgi:outer membrane receptor protein involved in Fe transport
MRVAVAIAVGCLIAGVAIADSAKAAARKPTSIPPQDLKSALQTVAADRDFQILYRTEIVGDRRTDGATGELDMDETLTRLLDGTGLSYRYLDDNTITILPPPTEGRPSSASRAAPSAAGPDAADPGTDAVKGDQKRSFWDRFRLARMDQGKTHDIGTVADSNGAEPKSSAVEEVVVTAQKRIERVRDVPASIAVVTADEISRRGLVNSEDYLRGLPGVNQSEAVPNGQAIIIRGLETTVSAQNHFAGPTTATYFGETPTTSSAGLNASNVDLKLIDIERVEVLRGPQGTAFGSSSMGGAVRTIPVAPMQNFL